MPFPLEELSPPRSELRVVVPPAAARATSALVPRVLAHLLDLALVQGVSLYCAKFFAVALISFHAGAIGGSGRRATPLFLEAYETSRTQLFAAAFAAIAVAYFVGMPMVTGRTFGMGLFGLRVRGATGEPASMRQLLFRFLGCALTYATGGLLAVTGLRHRDGKFFQDQWSGTCVTHDQS